MTRTTASSGASPLASEHCALLPMPSACPSPPQLMMRTTASSGASLLSVRPSAAASGTATSTATLSCAHAWQQEVQRRWQVCVWGGWRAAQGRGVLEGSSLIPRPYPPSCSCCGARRGKPAALPFASPTLCPCPSSSPPSCPSILLPSLLPRSTLAAAAVVRGEARNGAAIIRPPGHHAESGTAMG